MSTEIKGKVVHLTDNNFAEFIQNHKGLVLVDFWAEWCGPCRMLGPVLEDIASEMVSEVTVAKFNVDENPSVAGQMGIRSIPAVKFFKGGQEVFSQVGAYPKDYWVDVIEKINRG